MTTVRLWSGREIRALREARRMSQRDFAAHFGFSERMIAKWEAGGEKINPRPVNQAALDSSLATASPDVHARFEELLDLARQARTEPGTDDGYFGGSSLAITGHQVRHPIDGKLHLLNHPVVFVTWHDAVAYASWAAKSLPSDERWEKAARGERGDTYPWGSQLTAAKCNVRESGIRSTTPVDRYHSGASPYGVYDMCGNVWEWLSTQSVPGRYELKGSAFTSPFARATPSMFNDASAEMLDDDTGFRCAIPAETMRALLTMNS